MSGTERLLEGLPVFLAWAPKIGKKHRGRGLSGKIIGLVLDILDLMYLHEVHRTIKYRSGDVSVSAVYGDWQVVVVRMGMMEVGGMPKGREERQKVNVAGLEPGWNFPH